jgi:hypothetical protein
MLDISPTMFENAKGKYDALTEYLKNSGIEAQYYTQGSFALGTVVRPYIRGVEKDYDLDTVCELFLGKTTTSPFIVKRRVGEVLKNSKRYKPLMLGEDSRCWTLQFSDVDGIGFLLDVVPCVHQDNQRIVTSIATGVLLEYANQGILITDKVSSNDYRWLPSNPKGYAAWFNKINEKIILYADVQMKQHLGVACFSEDQSKIEKIPTFYKRSVLQRAIQILKRHRDIYFSNVSIDKETVWGVRPISAIITTLCTQIAEKNITDNLSQLLGTIAKELNEYTQLQNVDDSMFFERNRPVSFIHKENGKWILKNPVNPDDNLTDAWTLEHARWFFKWTAAVKKDFEEIGHPLSDQNYFSTLKSSMGKRVVESTIPESKVIQADPISMGTRDWGC